ncbi:DUF1275 family protein [Allobranchiibius huperziae]|uniref:Uncharacterized membrane protein YoaK (UPF0700 family) n=1 Tax=Allobranchiibius huperziae TaxID=1874116 RepID=A0A853DFA0_9MICO|nr:uncharacterized membrane protein YoaK (UPF0700 family) [Allobranchiibius huperziae]
MPSEPPEPSPPKPADPWYRQYVAHPDHGPLPILLLLLTASTGVVDAVSILRLGRVFVANMTGNVVFIGFALAGAPGFSLVASLVALVGFLVGAGLGGTVVTRYGGHRGVLLRNAVAAEAALLLAAALVLLIDGRPYTVAGVDVAVALAAVALGLRNAAVRRLAVPDFTTTVLTMTLTGIAADLRQRNIAVVVRRILAIAAMLVGALIGALLVSHSDPSTGLLLSAVIAVVVAVAAAVVSRRPQDWQRG